ncbi:MAG: LamG-like jellyroll fold domain-containing protein, partial [Planctomycetota bacterium]
MKKQVVLVLVVLGAIAGEVRRVEALEYLAGSIVVDDSSGNANGKLEPGESVGLSLSLVNWWADATNVEATLSCGDSFVSITKGVASFADVLYGGVTDNNADAFVVSLDVGCPDTRTLEFTLEVTAEGPNSYSSTSHFNYAVMLNQQGYDDGEADGYVEARRWVLYDEEMAVRITPESYPCLLTHVRLFPCVDSNSRIIITVWDDNSPGGLPGALLGSVKTDISAADSNDWLDVDVTPIWVTIDEGSFYVRFSGSVIGAYHNWGIYRNGIDTDPPYYGRSWHYERDDNEAEYWYPFEEYGLLANLMVRVRYASSTEDGPVENLTSGKRYDYIQQAIFEAEDGDEIVAAEGVYNETINFWGKHLIIRSIDPTNHDIVAGTIIKGNGEGPVVTFSGGEDPHCVLAGFTITDGNEGIYCESSSPTIRNCRIVGNRGAGIKFSDEKPISSDSVIVNCTIIGNAAEGIYGSMIVNTLIGNCLVAANRTKGIHLEGSRFIAVKNCTIVENGDEGLYAVPAGIAIDNCIIRGNSGQDGPEIVSGHGYISVNFSNVKGGWEGTGNIDVDPCFVELGSWVPFEASKPNPPDRRINVDPNIILSWSPGRAATSHDVYFGTNFDGVNNATTDSNEFMGDQDFNNWDTSNYDPCGLAIRTTYYWRVDEVNELRVDSPWKGHVWSFTTFDPNLVGWWELDEGAGTWCADSTAYGNNGTMNGLVSWVEGHGSGYALDFSLGNVTVPDANELRPMHQVTASAWINYHEPYSVHGHVVCKGLNDYETFSLERGHGYDQMNFMIRDDETYTRRRVWGFGLERDEWVHIAGAYDGSYMSCYINGDIQDWYFVGAINLSQNTGGLGIGNRVENFDAEFVGIIDDVRVYDRGMSADEIRKAYQQGLTKEQMIDYGGDYHLQPGSPCIDVGSNLAVPLDLTDLDGNPRIADGSNDGNAVVDMGAYEFFMPPIEVAMKFTPQALNPGSRGRWVKAHFVLPEEYTVEDVDANRPAVVQPGGIESDYINVFINESNLVEVEAAFDRGEFCGIVTGGQPMEASVTGSFISGQQFYGTDTIKITTNTFEYLAVLATYWLEAECGKPDWCEGADLDRDSVVNFVDFALFDGCCIEV